MKSSVEKLGQIYFAMNLDDKVLYSLTQLLARRKELAQALMDTNTDDEILLAEFQITGEKIRLYLGL